MKRIFIFTLYFMAFIVIKSQGNNELIISEVMFNCTERNTEFIELYNNSKSKTFNLENFKIVYASYKADGIVAKGNKQLLPGEFAIILEGDYEFTSGLYKNLVPLAAKIFVIDNNSFGRSGMSNSSDKEIRLIDATNKVIDFYTYSANNKKDFSDERIATSTNWKNSLVKNGTPGFKNSVSPKDYDVKVSSFSYSPILLTEDKTLMIKIWISNIGLKTASPLNIAIYNDDNLNALPEADELIEEKDILKIEASDSVNVEFDNLKLKAGKHTIIIKVKFASDEMPSNNSSKFNIEVLNKPIEYNAVIINEFMFSPIEDEPEWVELYNRSNEKINLKDWTISDKRSKIKITGKNIFINPKEYIIITEDLSIKNYYKINSQIISISLPSLNNTNDDIVLSSPYNTIDSVSYNSGWGTEKSNSLERIEANKKSNNKSNWQSSILRGTPGKINSVTPKEYDLSVKKIVCGKYQVLGSLLEGRITLKNTGLNDAENFSILLYMKRMNANFSLLKEYKFSYVKKGDTLDVPFSIGNFGEGKNHIMAVSSFSEDNFPENDTSYNSFIGIELNESREDIIINEIMFLPPDNLCEWIELYNRSNKTINICGYQIADAKDTATVVRSEKYLKPEEYIVVANDSSIYDFYEAIEKVVISKFPVLNNSSDKIIILDSLNRVIDSVLYKKEWLQEKVTSLERLLYNEKSDSTSWKPYKYSGLGTPTKINSVSEKNHDLKAIKVYFNPQSPFYNDDITISTMVKNIGKEKSYFKLNLIYNNRVMESSQEVELAPADSLLYKFNYVHKNIVKPEKYLVNVKCEADEDTLNNKILGEIIPGILPTDIIINEVMINSDSDEPEWIEFYNKSNRKINLKFFNIADKYKTSQTTTIIEDDFFINPKSYFIISKDSTINYFHKFKPQQIIYSNFSNLNNDKDAVVIKDSRGITIDSLLYNELFDIKKGFSLERISFADSTNLSSNWKSSIDFERSTPGRINSKAIKKFDPAVVKLALYPKYPKAKEDVNPVLLLTNLGTKELDTLQIEFYYKKKSKLELLESVVVLDCKPQDTLLVKAQNSIPFIDSLFIVGKIISKKDEDIYNNIISKTFVTGYSQEALLISEIMFAPLKGQAEWVELYNASSENINLKDWSITTKKKFTERFLIEKSVILKPKNYLILSADSTIKFNCKHIVKKIPPLSNEEIIFLYDNRDFLIDSIGYSFSNFSKGISIEHLLNNGKSGIWRFSLNDKGNTAGKPNSINNINVINSNSITINEILFSTDTSRSEFIELYNRSNNPVELGWLIIENQKGETIFITNKSKRLFPKEYFIICQDSTIIKRNPTLINNLYCKVNFHSNFSLSNTEGSIVLMDLYRNTIDSVFYSEKYHNSFLTNYKNISLEKINPNISSVYKSNWNSCVNDFGSTPQLINSIFIERKSVEDKITISPNPFSPDNDGYEDYTIINLNLKELISQIRIKIYDDHGRLVRSLSKSEMVGSSSQIIFDGLDDSGNPLKIGIYILYLEALGTNSETIEIIKTPFVIGRKL